MQISRLLNWLGITSPTTRSTKANILLLLAGLGVGVVATILAVLCDWSEGLFLKFVAAHPYWPLIITPLGFVLLFYMAHKIFPGAQGSGIPEAIAALECKDEEERNKFLSFRVLIGKFVLTVLAFLCGASIGREGPTVLIGSTMMYLLTRTKQERFKLDYVKRGLIIAGGGAGIAAAFYTPLAGIVFAIEEHSKAFEIKLTKILIGTIMLSGFVCVFYFKGQQFFSNSYGPLLNLGDWIIIPLCGLLGGILGGLFTQILVKGISYLKKIKLSSRLIFAFFCGLIVALVGIISHNHTYGSSYLEANQLITGAANLHVQFGLFKWLVTLVTSLSGICGGILAPSLAIGAGLGNIVSHFLPNTSHSAVIILGMVAYFTGVVRSPITCFVIVLEMTGRYDLIIPLMATTIIAEYSASLVSKNPVYTALANLLMPAQEEPSISS